MTEFTAHGMFNILCAEKFRVVVMSNEYIKNFSKWSSLKKSVDEKKDDIFFDSREIWWCNLGVNIGYEQDGKSDLFTRPVLILKKHNKKVFTAIPLSSKVKPDNPYYQTFTFQDKEQSAVILQIRLIDSKTLISRMGYLSKGQFNKIKARVAEVHL
jgi:mRNA interferase MazF